MAAVKNGVLKLLFNSNKIVLSKCKRRVDGFLPVTRNVYHFKVHTLKPEKDSDVREYEETKDPNEWKYVERLLPIDIVPEVKPKASYPSGWRPQTAEPNQYPYFIERSINHMLPVYLHVYERGISRTTSLKKVRGDIWALYSELKKHLETVEGHKIGCYVHESNSAIVFMGDKVYNIEQWLLAKGF